IITPVTDRQIALWQNAPSRLMQYLIKEMTSTITDTPVATPDFSSNPERIIQLLAGELGVRPAQIAATVQLLDEGATVPFIARYRKEVTGGLDDTVLRNLEVRLIYVRELESRRTAILESI